MIRRKVRVRMPQAQSGLEVKMKAGLGYNANQLSWPVMAGEFSEPDFDVNGTLKPVDRDEANLEAEVGETAVTNLNADGIPEHYKIGGKRHYDGGTPLNLPDHSYIFSRDNSMKIKDKAILEQFGVTKAPRGGVTPADIAKKYDLNKYKKILLDKNTDDLARSTAEMMIANFVVKLGKLAIVQESMKNFPEGIPYISMPYLESIGMNPEDLLPSQEQVQQEVQSEEEQPFQDMPTGKYGIELPKHQTNGQTGLGKEVSRTLEKDAQGEYVLITYENGSTIKERKPEQVKAFKNKSSGSGGGGKASSYNYLTPLKPYLPSPPLADDLSKITTEYDPRLSEDGNDSFNNLTKALSTDQNMKDLIRQRTIERLQEAEENATKSGKADRARNLSRVLQKIESDPDYALSIFLKYQKQNYLYKELREDIKTKYGVDINDKKFGWDERGNVGSRNQGNKMVEALFKYYGFNDDDIVNDDDETIAAQAATLGILDIEQSDDYNETFKKLGLKFETRGQHRDQGNVIDPLTNQATFSGIEGYYGDNTIDVTLGYRKKEKERKKVPCKPCDDGTVPEMLPDGTCPCGQDDIPPPDELPDPKRPNMKAPWWLQDIIKVQGDAYDYMNIKKYMPWQATPAVDFMEPEFYSPERELAANAEQLAIGASGAAMFTGPQAYNARYSQMAGKAATNSADILARYNNLNVGVANQAEKFNVDTFNEYAEDRADDATALYDKVVTANQQYDNAKNEARQNMRQSYIDAITNRAQTASLNALYPNYAVDPSTGGMPMFIPGWGKPKANKPARTPQQMWNDINKLQGLSQEAKENIFKSQMGVYEKEALDEEDEEEDKLQTYPGSTTTTKKKK